MLRLVLLSLALAVCQCDPCSLWTWIQCKCENILHDHLFTATHVKANQWITKVTTYDAKCDKDEALYLWNNITEKNKCIPTHPIPPTGPEPEERPPESEMIKKGYERHGASLYKFHSQTQDWESARRTCVSEGAHLAIVNSEDEAKLIINIFSRYPLLSNALSNDYAMIGFHDQFEEGNYLTIFGEPIEQAGYDKWEIDNPSNSGKDMNTGHPGENCGSISRQGLLNDVPCWTRLAFICEQEDGGYSPTTDINYITGYYTGVESVIKPPPGTVIREIPSLAYTHYPGVGFYKMHTTTETWENARRICESEDAHLAIINSEQESAVLSVVISKQLHIYDTYSKDFAFIGFHDQYTEGQYLTIYNETLQSTGFMKWAANEPNNYGASNVNVGEDCGAVHKNGLLNDLPCHRRLAFICEQPLLM